MAKNQHTWRKSLYFVHQKFGMILGNKVGQKLKLSKNTLNAKCAAKLLFLIDKRIWKNLMILDTENLP